VVATRDRPESLLRSVRALIAQDVGPGEIIVVDQGTAPLQVDLPAEANGVEVLVLRDEGVGLSRARNLALEAARCPFVAVVDDDCIPDAGWLAAITSGFSRHNGADGVCGPVLPLPRNGERVFPVSSRTSRTKADYTSGAVPWRVGTGGNFAARTDLVRTLGGYDCRLGAGSSSSGGEDIDLIYRMLRAGATIRYCPEAIVRHERVTAVRRRATRRSYGRGIGAFIGLRGRERDLHVGMLLLWWVLQRLAMLARAALYIDRRGVMEEAIVLAGTAAGLSHGLRMGGKRGRQ
jgi:GT2 family glycosyltransferase